MAQFALPRKWNIVEDGFIGDAYRVYGWQDDVHFFETLTSVQTESFAVKQFIWLCQCLAASEFVVVDDVGEQGHRSCLVSGERAKGVENLTTNRNLW